MGIKHAALFGLCVVVTACGTAKHPAPVYDLKMNGSSAGSAIVGGRVVSLAPPSTYRARHGDTAYSVANMFDLRVTDIIAQNNLHAPYQLHDGQVISLSRPQQAALQSFEPAPLAAVPQDQVMRETLQPPMQVGGKQETQTPTTAPRPPRTAAPAAARRFARPVQGEVVSAYGSKADGLYNEGINIAAKPGTQVRAADAGTVVYAGDRLSGYGNLVLIKHDNEFFTVYGHMADTRVAKGASVARGQTIGTVGTSGQAKTPQLHFEIRQGTKSLDPQGYLMPE
jgi:murein DD-endopeptidase MepM/ murein hydrolase activator NlpD